ncbi:uncharacterized protein LOC121734426 [Aricia agestis]|uniref:uncharacterized protein LOC121734426 n=1 Tax=Aricia agestis TaxID=91739 RepID=UPI001C202376|nr:uncharacterized protein LOC121734426 [Aricia agestis]
MYIQFDILTEFLKVQVYKMIEFAIILCTASSALCHNYGWSQGYSSSYAHQSEYAWQGHNNNYQQAIPNPQYWNNNNQQNNYYPHTQPNYWSHVNYQNIPQPNWSHENYQNIPYQWSDYNQPNINNYPNQQNPNWSNGNNNWQVQPSQQLNTAEVFANDRAADPNQQALQAAPMYNKTHNPCTREIVKPDFKRPGRRVSEEKCLDYIWQIKFREDSNIRGAECSKYRREYLNITEYPFIGGRTTEPGEFPHMVALGWKAVEGDYIFKCGGSLISPKFVVTAAHCSRSPKDPKVSNQVPEIIRIGAKNLAKGLFKGINQFYPRDVKIVKITNHPNYKSPRQYSDIALVELDIEVVFDTNVQPACLWGARDIGNLGAAVSASGWGVTEIGGKTTTTELQVGDLDVIDDNYCDQLLRPKCNRYWCGLQEHQMCAGKLAGGVDACQGDSGGPLQSRINLDPRLKGKMYYLLGVTSVGFGCARQNTPGIYSRISSFLDWIEPIVWPNGFIKSVVIMGLKSKVLASVFLFLLLDILVYRYYYNDSVKELRGKRVHIIKPRISQIVYSKACEDEKEPTYLQKGRISEKKCLEYVWKRRQFEKCEKYHKKHVYGIIGGYEAMPGDFPHMAAIGWRTIFGGWTFKCGATIISPRFLVTAAHCTKSKPHRILQNTVPEIVRLGVVNLKHFPNNDAVDVNISRIMKYPKYKSPRKYFDIALLELQEEVKFGAAIQPACLWSKSSTKELGKRVVASGWGITNVDKRSPSSLLRAVNLLMINEELCEHLLKPFANRHWSKLADHQLCAGELAGGLDACQGDSGGPLQVQMDNQHKMYYLIGVTSFGYSCGLPNVPGLYTRVASFIDWIEDNVWKEDIDRLSRNTSTLISKPIR